MAFKRPEDVGNYEFLNNYAGPEDLPLEEPLIDPIETVATLATGGLNKAAMSIPSTMADAVKKGAIGKIRDQVMNKFAPKQGQLSPEAQQVKNDMRKAGLSDDDAHFFGVQHDNLNNAPGALNPIVPKAAPVAAAPANPAKFSSLQEAMKGKSAAEQVQFLKGKQQEMSDKNKFYGTEEGKILQQLIDTRTGKKY